MNFELPEIGEGVQEGELIAWKVKPGDTVKMDEPLVEVMTDKATVEIPSPVAGTIKELKAKEGDRIKVGQVLLVIDESGAKATATSATTASSAPTKTESPAPTAPKTSAHAAPKTETTKSAAAPSTSTSTGGSEKTYTGNFQTDSSSIPASPYVRAMAAKSGVDLKQVRGTGPAVGGVARVLEEDVLHFIDQHSSAYQTGASGAQQSKQPAQAPTRSSQASPGGGGSLQVATSTRPTIGAATPMHQPTKQLPTHETNYDEVVERKPLRGLRRAIAQAMVRSKFTAPHFTHFDEFECSALMALREEIKKSAEQYGIKFSYLPLVVKSVVSALKEFPEVNASLEEKDGNAEILLKKYYHIGFAVATENGLIVPVIKHADKKSLLQIADEIQTLSERTRTGKATSDELKGSTFSITSMGNIGGTFATPIINYPEVAIMGVYKIHQKPVVKNGQIVVGNTMALSISCDHRVVDGAIAGYFMNAVIDRLAHPSKLMLEMT